MSGSVAGGSLMVQKARMYETLYSEQACAASAWNAPGNETFWRVSQAEMALERFDIFSASLANCHAMGSPFHPHSC